jgi:hypothetical protein
MPGRAHAREGGRAIARRRHFLSGHRLGLLLALEVFAMFAIAPLIDMGMLPHFLLGITFTLILLVGMLLLDLRSWRDRGLLLLGFSLLPIQVWRYVAPSDLLLALHPIGLLMFLLGISWVLAHDVFASRQVKMDQVLGGVILYLNIGLTFAVAYTLVEQLSPGAFVFPQPRPSAPVHPTYFAYFSFVTLTTVGYGDTLPVQAVARSLATLEAALGQLYPAIILARLVSIQVSQHQERMRSQDRQQMAQDARRAAGDL